MLNKEQLDAIKERFENMQQQARTGFTADISAIEIAFQDVPVLIETVGKLMNVRDVSYAEYAELDAKNKRLREFERKAIYAIEENRKLREAITQVLEVVSDAEGELVERVERVLLGTLEGDDACL